MVYSDKNRLSQVLVNLLSNANKFTFNGNIVVLIDKLTSRDKDEIMIKVIDNGIGIKE